MATLLKLVRSEARVRHFAKRTEDAYVRWIEQYVRFSKNESGQWIHPAQLGNRAVNAFLGHLAEDRLVAASTQNQALSAILFLYRDVLKKDVKFDAPRARRPSRVPVVLSREEVRRLLKAIPVGMKQEAAQLSVRVRVAFTGGLPVAGQGHRFRPITDHRPRRQGIQRPYGPDATVISHATSKSHSVDNSVAPGRFGGRCWVRVFA